VILALNTPTATTASDDQAVVTVSDDEGGEIVDGAYQPKPAKLDYTYRLTKDNKDPKDKGEWRIVDPPNYLVMTAAQVNSSYQKGYVYFLRPDGNMLVPIRVFLPVRPDQLANSLLTTLLSGPPAWLQPAVTSALPPKATALRPTQASGVTTVTLSRDVASLTPAQRSEVAAQITFTLQNFGPVRIEAGTAALIAGQPVATTKTWSLFDADAVAVNSFYFTGLDHETHDGNDVPVAGDTGFGGLTHLVAPVVAPGRPGSATGQLIAGVVQNGKTGSLYAGPLSRPKELLSGCSFTTPSWDSFGNLWTVEQVVCGGPQQVRIAPSGTAEGTGPVALPVPVADPELANYAIEALKVSRDGTRVAVITSSGTDTQVRIGVVTKSAAGKATIQSFYPLAPTLTSVIDCTWASSTMLDILVSSPGANGDSTTSQLWSVDVDGWPPTLVPQQDFLPDAQSITAAPGKPLVAGTSAGTIEVSDNDIWRQVGLGTSPSYPG
jgi:hypothetical protein